MKVKFYLNKCDSQNVHLNKCGSHKTSIWTSAIRKKLHLNECDSQKVQYESVIPKKSILTSSIPKSPFEQVQFPKVHLDKCDSQKSPFEQVRIPKSPFE